MPEYNWLVIADDLTGANDTGHQFAAAGLSTRVLPTFPAETPPADVLVVNTDSRAASEAAAATAVSESFDGVDADRTYKKIDSTLRGNLRAELDALLPKVETPLVLVAPAFPSNGRITVDGIHLVDGEPVDEAESVRERENPPATARLAALFSDAAAPVVQLPLETVRDGEDAIATRLAELRDEHDETAIVVCDATTDAHLESIAAATLRLDRQPTYVGSAGLAGQLAATGARKSPEKRVLGVVGSTNDATFAQLNAVPDRAIVSLDVERALDDPAGAGSALAGDATTKLRDEGVAVVTSARAPRDVTRAHRYGEENDIAPDAVRERIEMALETAIETIWRDAPPDGVFVTGGTIATTTLRALGVADIALSGAAVAEGVPIASAPTRSGSEISLVTKAGGFGDRGTIVECLRALGAPIESVE